MITSVFLNEKRVNVFEHTVNTASCESFGKLPPGWGVQDRKGRSGGDGAN
jgi:hypothetical protein